MALIVSPTQEETLTVLKGYLDQIVGPQVNVLQAQGNRIPEVMADNFVLMTPRNRERLSTNRNHFLDCAFAGSILNDVLTVTAVAIGTIIPPAQIFSPSFTAPVTILSQLTGTPGGIGTYQLTDAPDIAASSQVGVFVIGQSPVEGTKFACGQQGALQPTKFSVQLDVHGEDSADLAQIISTMLWDEQAYSYFLSANPNVLPLYATDPRQLPFNNDQTQVENRWVFEALLQVNATVTAPQQFADQVAVGLINVDATYPP
jgi:hypothetical protein